jgi:hypothetical protein
MTTFGESIFGEGYDKTLTTLLVNSKDISTEDARKVLDAIQDPDMRKVIDVLEEQMTSGKERATYNHNNFKTPLQIMAGGNGILFDDSPYFNGLMWMFVHAVANANPEYEAPEEVGVGHIEFYKK